MSDDPPPEDPTVAAPRLVKFPANSATAWSPKEMVADFNQEIQTDKIAPVKILILWFSEEPNGHWRPHRWFANVSNVEEIALLELGKAIALAEWKD